MIFYTCQYILTTIPELFLEGDCHVWNFERLLKERGITAYKVAQETGRTTVMFSSWNNDLAESNKYEYVVNLFAIELRIPDEL